MLLFRFYSCTSFPNGNVSPLLSLLPDGWRLLLVKIRRKLPARSSQRTHYADNILRYRYRRETPSVKQPREKLYEVISVARAPLTPPFITCHVYDVDPIVATWLVCWLIRLHPARASCHKWRGYAVETRRMRYSRCKRIVSSCPMAVSRCRRRRRERLVNRQRDPIIEFGPVVLRLRYSVTPMWHYITRVHDLTSIPFRQTHIYYHYGAIWYI